jgi:hypothetical protein
MQLISKVSPREQKNTYMYACMLLPRLKGWTIDPLASPVGANTVSQKAPRATAGKRKANELDSSNSSCSMDPATRRPAPGPLSGAGSAPSPAQTQGNSAQGPMVKPTASTGEQAASSCRQLTNTEVGAAQAGIVAGRPVKGTTAGWIPRHRSPLKWGPLRRVKGGETMMHHAEFPPYLSPPEGRMTSRWEPLLADTWTLNPPCQTQDKWNAPEHSQG